MDAIGIIPARWGSSRFEGKVLADIAGKPMLQYVWEAAKAALLLDDVIIATDDDRVAAAAKAFGATVALTSRAHPTGTDRISEVVNPIDVRVIVNIQADEPLIRSSMIDDVCRPLLENPKLTMATLIKKIEGTEEINDPNVVKVVIDKNNFALYFSRSAIPHLASTSDVGVPVYYKHIGMYAYTKDFLFTYRTLPQSSLEKTEKLEQLRVLEEGFRIKTCETKYETIGVDTPRDLEKVREMFSS